MSHQQDAVRLGKADVEKQIGLYMTDAAVLAAIIQKVEEFVALPKSVNWLKISPLAAPKPTNKICNKLLNILFLSNTAPV